MRLHLKAFDGAGLSAEALSLVALTATLTATGTGAIAEATGSTFHFADAAAPSSTHGTLTTSPPSAATTVTGWTTSRGTAGYSSPMVYGSEQAAGTFGATLQPSTAPGLTDCFRTTLPFTGSFRAAPWTVSAALIAGTAANTNALRLRFRAWASTDPTGAGARELTTETLTTGPTTPNLLTTAAQTITATWSPGAVALSGEYLFLQPALEITARGGVGTTQDALIRVDPAASFVSAPAFDPGSVRTITATGTGAVASASGWRSLYLRAFDSSGLSTEALVHVGLPTQPTIQATGSGYVRASQSIQATGTGAVQGAQSLTAAGTGVVAIAPSSTAIAVNVSAYDAAGLSTPAVVHVDVAPVQTLSAGGEGWIQGTETLTATGTGEIRPAGTLRLRFESGTSAPVYRTLYADAVPRTLSATGTGSIVAPTARTIQATGSGVIRGTQTVSASGAGYVATGRTVQASGSGWVRGSASITATGTGEVAVPGIGSVSALGSGYVQAVRQITATGSGAVQAPVSLTATGTGTIQAMTLGSLTATGTGTVGAPAVGTLEAIGEGYVAERLTLTATGTGTVYVSSTLRGITATGTGYVALPATSQPKPDGTLIAYRNETLIARRNT